MSKTKKRWKYNPKNNVEEEDKPKIIATSKTNR